MIGWQLMGMTSGSREPRRAADARFAPLVPHRTGDDDAERRCHQDLRNRRGGAAQGNERARVRPRGLVEGTLPLNTIARTLAYDISEVADGRVVVTANPSDALLNPAGTVHGGFTATLLDSCMGLAVWSTLEKGLDQTTLEFKISLVRPITAETGPISAEGIVLNRGRRIGTAEGRITDRNGRLLSHGTTTCLIFES